MPSRSFQTFGTRATPSWRATTRARWPASAAGDQRGGIVRVVLENLVVVDKVVSVAHACRLWGAGIVLVAVVRFGLVENVVRGGLASLELCGAQHGAVVDLFPDGQV